MKSKQLKMVFAGMGASAALAMGALGVALGQAPSDIATLSEDPEITLGETTTKTTAPTEPETSVVTPPITTPPSTIPTGEPQ